MDDTKQNGAKVEVTENGQLASVDPELLKEIAGGAGDETDGTDGVDPDLMGNGACANAGCA